MDIITNSHFEDFKKSYDYLEMPESEAFERFVNYCIVSRYVKSESISKSLLEDITIGSGGDWGIDGCIIVVNGRVVTHKEMVDDLLTMNGGLNVRIALVQSKTSPSFNVAEFGQTIDGAEYLLRDVLGDESLPKSNEDLDEYRMLLKDIYSLSANFMDSRNPEIEVYFVTTGVYNAQADFVAKIQKAKDIISGLDMTSMFECNMLGRQEIVALYKETKAKKEIDIKVEQKMPLPEVDKVEDGYLCLIPYVELCKLFIDANGQLIPDVFYDNVRAYQGDNIVNRAMRDSVKNGNVDLFAAMNNGITVISKSMRPTGMNIHLSDYQIVNGCQTCNVLYKCQDVPNIERLKIAVKLIASTDKEIRDKIIVANNSQTEVKREQLVSLLPIQRVIEDYYNAQDKFVKLYYERRSKQYTNEMAVPASKVVTIPNQIQSFVSMIMSEPEKVRGYYGSIVEEFDRAGKTVFAQDTNPAFYYTSSLAFYKMEEMFSKYKVRKMYKKVKFHVLLAIRLFGETETMPALNSNKAQAYCDALCARLNDDIMFKKIFDAALRMVDCVLQRAPNDSDRFNREFTLQLKEMMNKINKINQKRKS